MSKLDECLEIYYQYRKIQKAYSYAFYTIGWDNETTAPKDGIEKSSEYIGVLSKLQLDNLKKPETQEAINYLYDHRQELDSILQVELKEVHKEQDIFNKIPEEVYLNSCKLFAKSPSIWANAKRTNNYENFFPTLKEIINYEESYIHYLSNDSLKGYNVLLNDFEEGLTIQDCDKFFNKIREDLVPFINRITLKPYPYNESFAHLSYPVEKQRFVQKEIIKIMNFNMDRGAVGEVEHPFTDSFGIYDVRVTNHFYEDMFTSSIFSAIHELGHATYEQQISSSLDDTFLQSGTCMSIHESQSRLYENMIGRSFAFCKVFFPILQSIFKEQLKDVSLDDYYHYVNKVSPSLIRTEADELTYPIHVLIRYELEKKLFNHEIQPEDLRSEWNKLYKENLGVDVPSDKLGILQDSHWSSGAFGYFPSYAIGSAYSAQFYHSMKKDLDIDTIILTGNLKPINDWLKEHIHKYGKLKNAKELLLIATGEEFNPQYYIDYLKQKFSKIYNLD